VRAAAYFLAAGVYSAAIGFAIFWSAIGWVLWSGGWALLP
jgi:hypothetical protein